MTGTTPMPAPGGRSMFHHVKELQFNARVSAPDPRFAGLLLEQFGGGNGELKAAMQYFVQAFAARQPYPEKYDLLLDIATEELSQLEKSGKASWRERVLQTG